MDAITEVQAGLARKAKVDPSHRFGDLWSRICREEWIRCALGQVLSNVGARTAGIDGITRTHLKDDQVQERLIQEIQVELKGNQFKPDPVRRVYIPKPNGKQRPLGIPTVKDRTVQMLLKMVLEPIWESDFFSCSSGFRIGRCTMDCIAMIWKLTNSKSKMYWAIEGDIKGCFDSIHHTKLMTLLTKRIQDVRILKLTEQFLTAGVMEQHLFAKTEAGTPQGGIVSPLLANIYLHELDRYWWDHYGSLDNHAHERRRKAHQGNNHLMRYADDFLLLTNGPQTEAERLKVEFGDFLREELKLELSPEKTLITHVNDGYDFLGFHIQRITQPKDGSTPVVLIFPSEKGQTRFKDKIRQLTDREKIADPLDKLKAYNRLAQGWAQYYRYVNATSVYKELDYWSFNRILFWLAHRQDIGPRQTWKQYVHLQTGRKGTRTNLAAKDEKGELLYRFKMADLNIRRYIPTKRDNPYLMEKGKLITSVSEAETPISPKTWTTNKQTADEARWRIQRRRKLEAAEHRCEVCGSQEELQVHHIKPVKGRKRGSLNHPPEWLGVLCKNCHRRFHRTRPCNPGNDGKPEALKGASPVWRGG